MNRSLIQYSFWNAPFHQPVQCEHSLDQMADQTTETVNQQKQETITKQKNPLRVEQGKRLVEYNCRKKEELKHLNEQITKQDDMVEHKAEEPRCIFYRSGTIR